jgi:creatinine amidohydrolase
MTPTRFWADLTTEAFRRLDGARTMAVLPLAAIEQHGPHLPVSVDCDIVEEVVRRSLETIDLSLSVLFLPTQAIGKSNEHIAFPGTLTLSAETLIKVLMEIGASVARAGVRKLILLNSHGGNTAVMDIVARDLRARHGLLTAACSCHQLMEAGDILTSREQRFGIHAGEGETSMMLATRGDLVHMDKAKDFRSKAEDYAEDFSYIGVGGGRAKLGWLIDDLHPDGACGDASLATAEKGERLFDSAAQGLAAFLAEFDGLSADGLGSYRD